MSNFTAIRASYIDAIRDVARLSCKMPSLDATEKVYTPEELHALIEAAKAEREVILKLTAEDKHREIDTTAYHELFMQLDALIMDCQTWSPETAIVEDHFNNTRAMGDAGERIDLGYI